MGPMRVACYLDFVSPFVHLALHRLRELPAVAELEHRPVLLAGLLHHHGQKGPAEIPEKRRYTYRFTHFLAGRLGIPLRYPAGHPFNPLPYLRLAVAAGATPQVVRRISDAIWTTGVDAADPAVPAALARDLGVEPARLDAPEVKDALRRSTEAAAARGVFGVPTFEVDGELFFGADSLELLGAFLADPAVLRNPEVRRLDALPISAARKL